MDSVSVLCITTKEEKDKHQRTVIVGSMTITGAFAFVLFKDS